MLGLLPQGAHAAEPSMPGSLSLAGDSGDPISLGRSYSYSSPADQFSVQGNALGIRVVMRAANGEQWGLEFDAPGGEILVPATYVRALKQSIQVPKLPGMEVYGPAGACDSLSGTFKVLSINTGADREFLGIHLTFEQHCERGPSALRGELRLGTYGPDQPEPLPQIPVYPDTAATPAFLDLTADPASWVGGWGEDYSYRASDLDHFTWTVDKDGRVIISVLGAEGDRWGLRFSDPADNRLLPGKYSQTSEGFNQTNRGLNVNGNSRACNRNAGTFEVTRADYREDGSLQLFQASFNQRCDDRAGELRGQVSVGLGIDKPRGLNDAASGWGYNGLGGLGNGAIGDRVTAGAVQGSGFHKIAAGGLHSLGLKDDGSVWAWGWNGFGQLGDATLADRRTPTKVKGLENVASISAGFYSSLAVKRDGTVWAWGWNGFGQAGDGTRADRSSPVRVRGLENVVEASAGMAHSLALKKDGTVWAWGWNAYGQIGDGTTADRLTPVQVRDLTRIRHVSAGGLHSLALDHSLRIRSWGSNVVGQLGDTTNVDRHTPVTVAFPDTVAHISAGLLHSVANSSTWLGAAAWGWNGFGQLGDGTTVDRNYPVFVPGVDNSGPVSAGCYHSLGVNKNGSVASWGWNGFGQLGNGSLADKRVATEIPRPAPGQDTSRIAAGCFHSLALHRVPAGS
jgi:YD repeat-containing protein